MTKLQTNEPKEIIRKRAANVTLEEQVEWVKDLWRANPRLSINGTGGVSDRCLEQFGRAFRTEQLAKIKIEIQRELDEAMRQNSNGHHLPNPVLKQADVQRVLQATAAPPARQNKPGSSRSLADTAVRRAFCRRYMQDNPHAIYTEVCAACKAEYGVGVDNVLLGEVRRELGLTHRLTKDSVAQRRFEAKQRQDEPPPKRSAPPVRQMSRPEEAVRTAVELLVAEVPGLQSLTLEIKDGRPVVRYEVQTVARGDFSL